jgi:hypothetical protein
MDITLYFKKVTVFLDQNALVSSPEQLAVNISAPVVALRINTIHMPHYA